MTQLFIPEKIRVGYQNRSDTYTKRLAYIIYYDAKGKIRKETSFEDWRDKKIAVEEFENKPHGGFSLNKGVERYGHWGSGRSMVRVYDDRGMEFEITIDNLMFILMGDDCTRRELSGKYVYAWGGTELILLPVSSQEYTQSTQYTSLQGGKVSAKTLIPGAVYRTKKEIDLIYLGRFDWHSYDFNYETHLGETKVVKKHIFQKANFDKKKGWNEDAYYATNEMTALATIVNDTPVENYAELMKKFSKSSRASKIKSLFTKEKTLAPKYSGYSYSENGNAFLTKSENNFELFSFEADTKYVGNKNELLGWIPNKQSTYSLDKDGAMKIVQEQRNYGYGYNSYGNEREIQRAKVRKSVKELNEMGWVELWVELENGSKMKVEEYISSNQRSNW